MSRLRQADRSKDYNREMAGTVVVYLGFAIALVGALGLVRPMSWLRMKSRAIALAWVGAGLTISLIGMSLPAPEQRAAQAGSRLDEFAPVYQFSEFHALEIKASCTKAYAATQQVTAEEIRFFRTLVWLRRFGRPGRESILNPTTGKPILQVATQTSFLKLADDPAHEIVLGTIVARPPGFRVPRPPTVEWYMGLRDSGLALAMMNFRFQEHGTDACYVTTETRVFATSADVRRAFARYWRVIYPGSALIRRMWLRAIKSRAEVS